MHSFVLLTRGHRRIATLALFAILAGCDGQLLAPRLAPEPLPPLVPVVPTRLAEVSCIGDRRTVTVTCGRAVAAPDGRSAIIVGGQDEFVTLTSSNSEYDATAQVMSFDVTIRNLIPQTMGTSDGTTQDPAGVRVFFHEGPLATVGTGVLGVRAPDGYGTFTAANQPYYTYATMIPQYALSAARTWSIDVPATVIAFAFKVYVEAPVPFPAGYVRLQSGNTRLRADATRFVTATSKTALGTDVKGTTFTWTTSDTTLATVDATGTVFGVRDGAVTVLATDGVRNGIFALTVTPIGRVWTAGLGTTSYDAGANWSRGVVPTPRDTIKVPGVGTSLYPALVANETVGGLIVEDGGRVDLGTSRLTIGGDVSLTGTSALASAPLGNLVLAGIGRTLTIRAGSSVLPVLPKLRVTGTYLLDGNLTVKNQLRIESGRLTNAGYRIRVDNTP